MTSESLLVQTIVSDDPALRNRPIDGLCRRLDTRALLTETERLEQFRKRSANLYHTVRALFFLYFIHRFSLPRRRQCPPVGRMPFSAIQMLRERRFEEAIRCFKMQPGRQCPSAPVASGLATAYRSFAFQKLADQVRSSVRAVRGNQWMFRIGHPYDHPLRVVETLLKVDPASGMYPLLCEKTPVRMDLCHSAWSDIFFLGMDFPEGARVLNISVDLGVMGRDNRPSPPVEAYFRVIDEPVLRLSSIDLGDSASISSLREVFDFAKDSLGLLKAAVIASGILPPGIEGSSQSLAHFLESVVGRNRGIELVSKVNDIPQGSRLAVSTNLLSALIAVCMRATNQIQNLAGPLSENDRRTVAARAILGEWLGGAGGGWQDSGGIWPGIKLIQGAVPEEGDPEYGASRGRLLPQHKILDTTQVSEAAREHLQSSLVLVHGGMSQNVGPILEMVTEKYLLRLPEEWRARQEAGQIFDAVIRALKQSDFPGLASQTTRHFFGPIQTIVPWATNHYTEAVIAEVQDRFGRDFRGFCMLGGMSGGGMAFFFNPKRQADGQRFLLQTMQDCKNRLEAAFPFAVDPFVYDFSINEEGSRSYFLAGENALMPRKYYDLTIPNLVRKENRTIPACERAELRTFAQACRQRPEFAATLSDMFARLVPQESAGPQHQQKLRNLLRQNGFDPLQHERIRSDLQAGRIGLMQNRIPSTVSVEDASESDVADGKKLSQDKQLTKAGEQSIRRGEIAVITLAAGAGSRWTKGAGTVKMLHPFCRFAGRHRNFLEVHLAKTRKTNADLQASTPHVFTTSYLTHQPVLENLSQSGCFDCGVEVFLSEGKSIGLRMIPTTRDLRFHWEERQRLEEQQEKLRESGRTALLQWAQEQGEGKDYTDNLPSQCLHPLGHWYEFANLLRNGTLRRLLQARPNLQYLFLHNLDTLGAHLDPALLGFHIKEQASLTFEVIPRWADDQGGGLARVDGRLRLIEGLALFNKADEFKLRYYNSNSNWIRLDGLLSFFGLQRPDLADKQKTTRAVRDVARRLPAYVTLKEVKKRWRHGQETVFLVSQFEKIWGDMTALQGIQCQYALVPRQRGQQLKDPAQLDGWLREGSADYLNSLCQWP